MFTRSAASSAWDFPGRREAAGFGSAVITVAHGEKAERVTDKLSP